MTCVYFMMGEPQRLNRKWFWRTRKKTFCGFSIGSNQFLAERVYDMCVLIYMTGAPKSGFMEMVYQT